MFEVFGPVEFVLHRFRALQDCGRAWSCHERKWRTSCTWSCGALSCEFPVAFFFILNQKHDVHPLCQLFGNFPALCPAPQSFFPRASERRVLPIVGVCISSSHLLSHLLIFTPSHLHICSSSHLLIFTSAHLHTFSSSHLLIFPSAPLHICSSSHLHICSSSHLLSLSLSSFLSPFSLSFLSPFSLSRLLYLSLFRPRAAPAGSQETSTLSHEMRVDRQKLRKNCDFTCPGATLSHKMRVDRQKLRKNCDFTCAGATLSHEMRVDRQKLMKNCEFYLSWSNSFRTK